MYLEPFISPLYSVFNASHSPYIHSKGYPKILSKSLLKDKTFLRTLILGIYKSEEKGSTA
jgi:hypothetical protein